MPFTTKDWQDTPSTATPITAAALEDLEGRVTGYADVTAKSVVADPGVPNGTTDNTAYLSGLATQAVTRNVPLRVPQGTSGDWVISELRSLIASRSATLLCVAPGPGRAACTACTDTG
jgi:hypothetical protein